MPPSWCLVLHSPFYFSYELWRLLLSKLTAAFHRSEAASQPSQDFERQMTRLSVTAGSTRMQVTVSVTPYVAVSSQHGGSLSFAGSSLVMCWLNFLLPRLLSLPNTTYLSLLLSLPWCSRQLPHQLANSFLWSHTRDGESHSVLWKRQLNYNTMSTSASLNRFLF